MVEEVEIFPAEVECIPLAESKALEEAEVEVDSARVGQSVAPDVAKREARRRGIRRGIVEQWPADARDVGLNRSVWIADEIRT